MPKPLILFVHGLAGDSTETWGAFPTLIAADPEIGKRVDVDFYGYPTSLLRMAFTSASLKIQDLAASLKTTIEYRHETRSSIILVAHSMGGIICQKYLIDELTAERSTRIKAVALFAPPSYGSKLAIFGALLSWKHRHLWQLRGGSDLLHSVRTLWPHLCAKTALPYELVLAGQDSIVIPPLDVGLDVRLVADRNHTNLVKPTTSKDLAFLILRNLVLRTLAMEPSPEDTSRHPVLFDVYRPGDEQYYRQRREDFILARNMSWKNIWVYGPSGLGKTAALMRALSSVDPNFRYVSLGHYAGCDAKGLIVGLANSLGDEDASSPPSAIDWPTLIMLVVRRLEEALANGTRWILIEEIPLTTSEEFATFFYRLCAILVLFSARNKIGHVSLALSSVLDPRVGFQGMEKMAETLKVMKFNPWRNDDQTALIDLIKRELDVTLTSAENDLLLASARGSPRFIKVFFSNLSTLAKLGNVTVAECIAQTRQELQS